MKHLLSAVALALLLVITTAHLYGGILGQSVVKRPIHVTVAMDRTGGLFERSGVSYRGVRVGSVDSIQLNGDAVSVRVSISPGTQIPADSKAVVRTLSPAGEQFLDFQPSSSGGPYLREGSAVAAPQTSTPASVASTLSAINSLMSGIDTENLTTVLDELNAAFSDPDDLGQIVESGSSLLRTLDDNWPATLRIVENSHTVLRTADESSDEFRTFATSAKDLTAWLKEYDPKARAILDDSPGQIEQLRLLTSVLSLKLPTVLTNLESLADILSARLPHLRELLATFPIGLGRLGDTVQDGRFRVNMLVSPGDVCAYGADERSPTDPVRAPVVSGRSCETAFNGGQRSAQHVPGPTR